MLPPGKSRKLTLQLLDLGPADKLRSFQHLLDTGINLLLQRTVLRL